MKVVGLDHIQLAMPAGGEAAARQFYGSLLALQEIPKPKPLASRGGCWFKMPGADLHLGVDPNYRPARKAHPAFLVDDLSALKSRLDQAGVSVRRDESVAGVLRFFAADPFGNRLEFIQRGQRFKSSIRP